MFCCDGGCDSWSGVIGLTWAQDDEGDVVIEIVVVRDTDGKPVRNAEVCCIR